MKEEIKFSVLMSVYKKEKANNLKTAIDSIVNQTLIPNEFIIIEDGPLTSELENVLNAYTRKYNWIKTIKLEKNVGLGAALKEGVLHCNYEYIARMDSDDVAISNRFQKQINFLLKHPECDVLGGNIVEFEDLSQKDLLARKVPIDKNEMLKFLKKRNPMNHVTVIFKKESVLDVGNYLDCPYFEDYYLWVRMLKNDKKLINIDETLVRVRAGIEMTNRRGKLKYVKSIINFENKLYKLGFINYIEYLFNITLRSLVAFIPNKIRYYIYQEKLRDETK